MNWIIENWWFIAVLISAICVVGNSIICFYKAPNEKKTAAVKEWLLWAVTEAERIYKGGTGTLKLHYVYNLAIDKFPWLATLVTFDVFSTWVDDALIWMKTQLESNQSVKDYVEGKTDGVQ